MREGHQRRPATRGRVGYTYAVRGRNVPDLQLSHPATSPHTPAPPPRTPERCHSERDDVCTATKGVFAKESGGVRGVNGPWSRTFSAPHSRHLTSPHTPAPAPRTPSPTNSPRSANKNPFPLHNPRTVSATRISPPFALRSDP